MNRHRHINILGLFLLAMVVLIFLSAGASEAAAKNKPQQKRHRPEIIGFSAARFIFELNSTGQDMGAQIFLDGEPWERVMIFTPDGRKLLDIETKGNVKLLGLTELFAETHEPTFDEMTPEEVLALFPEGEYKFFGVTTEGDRLTTLVTVTHNIPEPTEILSPVVGSVVNVNEPVVIRWTTVPNPNPPESVIVGYEVIVEKDIEGERLRVLDIEVLPDRTSLTVPPEFLEPGKHYLFEVLPIESNGNQTITEGSFDTAN
jgi:hypothetical protein